MERDRTARGDAPAPNAWLHRFALLTAGATFLLIIAGGLVTSTGSGLAVPDWPLSYGQFFPPMVGGIFYEHGHRLVAATVGGLTTILAVWLVLREKRRAVRRLGLAALGAVILQGVLGGMTVLFLLPTPVSVAHACLGQGFFCLTVIFLQLVLGALMRHTGAGLAIPDFPIVSGRLPDFSSREAVIHFAHRFGAVAVASAVGWTFLRARREGRALGEIAAISKGMLALLFLQLLLGILTVLSGKSVAITTAHVATGALLLASALLLTLCAFRRFEGGRLPLPAFPPVQRGGIESTSHG